MTESSKAPTKVIRPQTLTWKAEVEFQGSPEEFVKLGEAFSAANVKFDFGKIVNGKIAGYVARRALDAVNAFGQLNETNSQRITLGLINGGITTPHFHLGKEIVLVDRTQFKNILGEVARDVFEQRALQMDDCLKVIAPLMESEE